MKMIETINNPSNSIQFINECLNFLSNTRPILLNPFNNNKIDIPFRKPANLLSLTTNLLVRKLLLKTK
jgi:hypothetical protein